MNKEQVYDSDIAPLVTQIIERAKAAGIQFHATFVLDTNDEGSDVYCTTHLLNDELEPTALRLMRIAAKTRENFDGFMFAVMRWARERGHTSAALHILGVPANSDGMDRPRTP